MGPDAGFARQSEISRYPVNNGAVAAMATETLPGPMNVANLRDFVESAAVAMHSVAADGTILWANQAELDLVGYSRDEYVGCNISRFHADATVIADIMRRLTSGETLRSYPARLRSKDGSLRSVLIDSSALFEGGKFVRTRCITRDVTRETIVEQKLRETEKWQRELIDALPVAVYTTDANGVVTHYNRAAADFAGRSPQVGIDRWCVTHRLYRVDGTYLPHDECPMAIALRTGEPVRGVEAVAERPDGSRVSFIPYPTPLRNSDGEVSGAVNVLVDITERKRAEEARARLAAIVETSDDAIISKNLNGIIQTWNAGAERIFGYTAEEAIGRSVTMLIPESQSDEEPRILEKLKRGERIDHYETVRRRKDGSLLDISLTISPMLNERGVIIGASKIARDITARKRAEAELKRANSDLEQFAYSASHDLQEPIRNIVVYSEILSRQCTDLREEKARECVSFIKQSGLRMDALVKGLMDYIQSDDSSAAVEEVDSNEALGQALLNLTTTIQETQAQITHDPLPRVRMRPGQMEHLFQNLVGNAVKYRRDDEAPRIHISVSRERTGWQFAVKDNGIGIAPEYQDRIFGIFKRLHTGGKYSGAGIGLAICQRIVERHGGRLWVESEGNEKGSTFFFTAPVAGSREQACGTLTTWPVS